MKKIKSKNLLWFSIALVVVFLFSTSFADTQKKIDTKKIETKKLKPISKITLLKPCDGPDLSAGRPIISKSVDMARKKGILNITGKITNIGKQDFVSNPNQASANIIVYNPGFTGPNAYTYVKKVPISRLNKGQSITLRGRYEISGFIEWNHRNPRTGECQAEVEVIVSVAYDPDIRMDSNPRNDDCNSKNDRCPKVPANTVKYMVECPW
jgi:hypothetical protein